MADFTRQLAIAFGAQSAEGTADTTIAALAGSLDLADGIILGDAAAGIVESGLSHAFERRGREKGSVSGGFTDQGSEFLEEMISTFTFAFPMAGPRTLTTTPAADDFDHQKGINDLLAACGLEGAASVSNPTPGWKYTPANVALATAKIFDSGTAWVVRDIRGSWSLAMTPGEIAIMTCTLSGIVDEFETVSFPTLDYEEQESVNAPSVSGVSPSWGISDEERGWTDLTIACVNDIAEIPDSASSVGKVFDQRSRLITLEMNMRDTDTDLDFTRSELVRTTTPTEDLKATIGTAAGASEAAVAYQIEASNIQVDAYTPGKMGESTKAASTITGRCTGTTDGSEFFLAFL